MPIYEYRCARCEREFEELVVRRADEAEVSCPACGARDVGRRMSRTAAPRTGAGASPAPRGCGPVG
jgi:putative FmdB family regulatory protein